MKQILVKVDDGVIEDLENLAVAIGVVGHVPSKAEAVTLLILNGLKQGATEIRISPHGEEPVA